MSVERKPRYAYLVVCAAILLSCELLFFRNFVGTGQMFGDTGDGRLTMLFTEHWYHFFRGEASFGSLGIFYPTPNTIAYSDMMLGFGVVHSIFRFLGMDIYSAYKYTLILVHLFGTISTFYLLNKVFNVGKLWSLFGTIAFSFSNTYLHCFLHPQMAAVSMVPLVVILAARFFQNLSVRRKRNLYAYTAIAAMILILYTAWYIAFFSALFAAILLIVCACVTWANRASVGKALKRFFLTVRYDLIGYVAFAVVLVIPFVLLELPILKATGGRSFEEMMNLYLLEPVDIIHVPSDNLAMGKLMQWMNLDGRNRVESNNGFSVVLLGVFIGTLFSIARNGYAYSDANRESGSPSAAGKTTVILCESTAVAVILGIIATLRIKIGDGFVSAWWLFYQVFPGANSIRAIGRFMLYLSLPMAVVTAVMADRSLGRTTLVETDAIKHRILTVALVAMLVVFSISMTGAPTAWNQTDASAYIDGVAIPPEDCDTFFIKNSQSTLPDVFIQMDAYQIADRYGLNTINGYSGMYPEHWDGISDIDSESYESAVEQWVFGNDLKNVYAYNESENRWERLESESALTP